MTATPPRADLRTLAAEAEKMRVDLAQVESEWLQQCGPCDLGMPEYGCTHPGGDYRPVMLSLVREVEALRRLAAAAPPAGLSAPVPAEDAPAVPEEADGQRGAEGDLLGPREIAGRWLQLANDADWLTDWLTGHGLSTSPGPGRVVEAVAYDLQAWATRFRDPREVEADRDRLAVAHYQRVVEAAKAWRTGRPGPWVSGTDVEFHLFAAVDALPDAMSVERDRGDWMQTYTGRAFYPMAPHAEDIDPLDIAHALSLLCRYGGHVNRMYSVAEHCVLMSYAVTPENALWALLHDATEAYVGDMIRPLKHAMPAYRDAEDRLMAVICDRFGIDHACPDEVKAADNRILRDERAALMGRPPLSWTSIEDLPALGVHIEGWSPAEAERRYLDRLDALSGTDQTEDGHG